MGLLDILAYQFGFIINDEDIQYKSEILTLFDTGILVDDTNPVLLHYMGLYNYHIEKNCNEAKKYYLLAIEKGCVNAMYSLGYYYKIYNNFEESEKYYLMAAEKGNTYAMNALGHYYYDDDLFEKSKKYYLMAILNKNYTCISTLSDYFTLTNDDLDSIINAYLHDKSIEVLFEHLRKAYRCYIYQRIGIECTCPICTQIKCKQNLQKTGTCDYCNKPKQILIPYDWCLHYLCIDCYLNYKSTNKTCPGCK